ncbi:M81 family metallopeptidase [Limibacillus halophilus]
MRIAVGGFQHETNTFAPTKAELRFFEEPDGWPGLVRGRDLPPAVAGINIPIAGAVSAFQEMGAEILPLSWCSAPPSAHVTDEAFETVSNLLLQDLKAAGRIDGLYLDLHGAMVTESHEDGEGELLRRLRDFLGEGIPIAASLDLHANVTPEMVACADLLEIYRTYPHIDMAETGRRAAFGLRSLIRGEAGREKAFRQIPFLLPLTGGCTFMDPAKSLYEAISEKLREGRLTSFSFACGFPPADIHDAGPSIVAYGPDRGTAEEAVESFAEQVLAQEAAFASDIYPAAEAVKRAKALASGARKPVVLADTQDNPGAGGNGDSTGLLRALIEQSAEGAVLGVLFDPEVALQAHGRGEGARLSVSLGAKSGWPGVAPIEGEARVLGLSDGKSLGTGPFYLGAHIDLGPCALLEMGGVRAVVGSRRVQAADQSMFRQIGVEPSEAKILALKSSVHFRADFQPIAEAVLVAAAPGPNPVDHAELDYQRLRPGVRLMPCGPLRQG